MCFKRPNTLDVDSWGELMPSGSMIENLGSLDKFTALTAALSKIAGLLTCKTYVDIVTVVYSWLIIIRGSGTFSMSVWIASCILTSLGFVAVSILLGIFASDVHNFIHSIAVFVYTSGTGQTFTELQVLVFIIGLLSRVIYWIIAVIGYVVHVLMIMVSLMIAITAVVLGVYTALIFDVDIPQITREDVEGRVTDFIPF